MAFVGLATGITASVAPALGVPDTTVIELVPEVVDATRAHFATANERLLERSDVHLVVDDGRRSSRHDRIGATTSSCRISSSRGTPAPAASMRARCTRRSLARLEPDGLFCQWLPLYQLTREEFDVIAHTFLDVFPAASLWRADFYADRPVVALVGFRTPRAIDLDAVPARVAALPRAMRDTMVASPRALAMLYAGDLSAVAERFAAAPFNTDDRPVIEFLAPRLTRMSPGGRQGLGSPATPSRNSTRCSRRSRPCRRLRSPPATRITAARQAGLALFRYANARRQGTTMGRRADGRRRCEISCRTWSRARSHPTRHRPRPRSDGGAWSPARRGSLELRREMSDMQRRLSDLCEGRSMTPRVLARCLGLLALGCGVAPVPGTARDGAHRRRADARQSHRRRASRGRHLGARAVRLRDRARDGPQVLAIELRAALARRGYAVVAPDLVVAATEGHPVYSPDAAAELARHGHLDEPVLMVVVEQWQPDAPTQPTFVIVALEAALVEPSSGTVLWHTRRRASPVATPGSVTLGAAYEIAVRKVVEELVGAWGTERPPS